MRNESINVRLYLFDICWGRGTITSTEGMKIMLKINATRMPNETKTPISLALGSEWDNRHKKLTIVVNPAKSMGIPTFLMVFFKI